MTASRKLSRKKYLHGTQGKHPYAWKIILRNLPFHASKNDIKDCLSKFGSIKEINLPFDQKSGQKRGFAFVTFERESSAKQAVKNKVNLCGRTVSLQLTTHQKPPKKQTSQEVTVPDPAPEEAVAVEEEEESEPEIAEGDPEVLDNTEDEDSEEEGGTNKPEDSEEGTNKPEDSEEGTNKPEDGPPTEPPAPLSLLYVRNLPYQVKKGELKKLLSTYGRLKRCTLLLNKATGKPLGSALVEYASQKSTKLLLKASKDSDCLQLHSRRIFVAPSVTKEEVAQRKVQNKEKKEKRRKNTEV